MRFIALLLLCLPTYAASWYLDNTASGSANGTSWANAWTDPASVVWGVSGVKAGDTLYISGGSTSQTYTNGFTVGASGTAANRITIRVGQDAGHNGTVIFDGQQFGNHCPESGVFIVHGRNYLTFDGEVSGQKNMQFLNWRNYTNKNLCNVIYGNPSSDNVFKFLVISNANTCIFQLWCTNNIVAWCDLTSYGDTVLNFNNSQTNATGNPWDSNLVFSNTLRCAFVWSSAGDGRNAPDGVQCDDSISIFNNRFGMLYTGLTETNVANHNDYLQTAHGGWIKWYNNELVDTQDSQCSPAHFGTASGFHDIRIYNNIFRFTTNQNFYGYDPLPQCLRMYNSAGLLGYTNVYILNNLFIDRPGTSQAIYIGNETGTNPGTGNVMANNIFVNCATNTTSFQWEFAPPDAGTISAWTITNNLYFTTNAANSVLKYTGTVYTVAQWKANIDPSTITNLPTFVSYTYQDENNNYRLQASDTVAKGKGINYSSVFTTDRDGNPRGSQWDLGPFQFTAPSPVGGFHALQLNVGRVLKP